VFGNLRAARALIVDRSTEGSKSPILPATSGTVAETEPKESQPSSVFGSTSAPVLWTLNTKNSSFLSAGRVHPTLRSKSCLGGAPIPPYTPAGLDRKNIVDANRLALKGCRQEDPLPDGIQGCRVLVLVDPSEDPRVPHASILMAVTAKPLGPRKLIRPVCRGPASWSPATSTSLWRISGTARPRASIIRRTEPSREPGKNSRATG